MTRVNTMSRLMALQVLLLSLAAGAALPFTFRIASEELFIAMDPPDERMAFQFGFKEDASSGYDAHDIPAPATTPPGAGIPILYLTATDPAIGGYSQDFRPPADSQAWELNLEGMSPGSSVTLEWRLQEGSLGGKTLSLKNRDTGEILVPDMMATDRITLHDEDVVLHVLYGSPNHPPLPKGDEGFMLQADGSLVLPYDALLANDVDPDGDSLDIVDVGLPRLEDPPAKGGGTTAYGTTTLDADNRQIIYSLPAVLPDDWNGTVLFDYTVTDNYPIAPLKASATVVVNIADSLVQDPDATAYGVKPGTVLTLGYTLRYTGDLQSLMVQYTMPTEGAPPVVFWQFSGNYSDDDDATADPVIDPGFGPDGEYGTEDDTGLVTIDFGEQVPASGTHVSFDITVPAGATSQVIPATGLYTVTGVKADPIEQRLQPVSVDMLYTATFIAGEGGSLTGDTVQDLKAGQTTTPVTAVPDEGYSFAEWTVEGTSYSTDNPLAVLMDNANITLTANFTINTHTVTFAAAAHGSLTGNTSQTVDYATDCTAVEAVPETGYHFARWTRDGVEYSTDNPLTVTDVREDMDLLAEFDINTYTVTFAAGDHGTVTGETTQEIPHGGSTTPVTAVPDDDYSFVRWDDGSTENPRTVSNVTGPLALTAEFIQVIPVDPDGEFDLGFSSPANPGARMIFDLTGHYETDAGNYALVFDMVHDEKGGLTGTGRWTGVMPQGTPIDAPLTIKGKAKGKGGVVTLKMNLNSTDADGNTASVKLKLALTLEGDQLVGSLSAKIKDDEGNKDDYDTEALAMAIPADMNGSILISVDLTMDEKGKITGDAMLMLSNGREVAMLVKGKMKNGETQLSLKGDKDVDPMYGSVKFKLGVQTFSDATGDIMWMKAKAFGQSITWP